MEILHIEGDKVTPKINFNSNTGCLILEGRSLPENTIQFYQPVLKWIENYSKSPAANTVLEMKLEYFNTASSKIILDLLDSVKALQNTTINWYYYEDDEDMEETGVEFSEILNTKFQFKILPE